MWLSNVSLLILLLARKHSREVTVPNITGVSKTQGKQGYLEAYGNCGYNAVDFPECFRKILLVSLLHKNTSSKINSVQQEFFKQYLAAEMVSGREEQAGSCSLACAYCQRGSNAHFVLLNNTNPFVEWLTQQQVIKK